MIQYLAAAALLFVAGCKLSDDSDSSSAVDDAGKPPSDTEPKTDGPSETDVDAGNPDPTDASGDAYSDGGELDSDVQHFQDASDSFVDPVDGGDAQDGNPLADGSDSIIVPDSCVRASNDDKTCDGVDDDCDGRTDEDYQSLTTIQCGVSFCFNSVPATKCENGIPLPNICEPLPPPVETDRNCNGEDDDCDGEIDEDYDAVPSSCGLGECRREGELRCIDGFEEDTCLPGNPAVDDASCNNNDDDCDGRIDEDFVPQVSPQTCGSGACVSNSVVICSKGQLETSVCQPLPPPRMLDDNCNSIDDDCDGSTDEDYVPYQGEEICGLGACLAYGIISCVAGEEIEICRANDPLGVHDQTCDDVDDDCDGRVDEDYVPHRIGNACGVGACVAEGLSSCVQGEELVLCTPGVPAGPRDDICNRIDDDCDGRTDEDYVPRQIENSCGVGECATAGVTSCVNGAEPTNCVPGVPSEEICDSLDNDCDGETDENGILNGLANGRFEMYGQNMDRSAFMALLAQPLQNRNISVGLNFYAQGVEPPADASLIFCDFTEMGGEAHVIDPCRGVPLNIGCADRIRYVRVPTQGKSEWVLMQGDVGLATFIYEPRPNEDFIGGLFIDVVGSDCQYAYNDFACRYQ